MLTATSALEQIDGGHGHVVVGIVFALFLKLVDKKLKLLLADPTYHDTAILHS